MQTYNVLFLCADNSARSVIAEALLNHWGRDRFRGFSAGSRPAGDVHPLALEVLQRNFIATEGLRPKSWDEFAAPEAPLLHFVVTVSDQSAQETCPVWPGQPHTANWGTIDPILINGTAEEQRRAFSRVFHDLNGRIKTLINLRLDLLDRLALNSHLDAIGRSAPIDWEELVLFASQKTEE